METLWSDSKTLSVYPTTGLGLMSRIVKPSHVAESAFSMECEVMHWYDIKTDNGDPANTVIIGRVKMMHVVSPPLFWAKMQAYDCRKTLCFMIPMLSN
jgi:flavin reductase (DIM6/NTAB) family NADH-FMN oxidoreductase RutF